MMKRGWEKTLPQIEEPDDLQPIANHPGFFVFHDGNNQKELAR